MNNISYIEELYLMWIQDSSTVGDAWQEYFSNLNNTPIEDSSQVCRIEDTMVCRQGRVDSLVWAYRDIGYMYARLNPLGGDYFPSHSYLPSEDSFAHQELSLDEFGIPQEDMNEVFFAGPAMRPKTAPLRDIISAYRETYCASIGVEFLHIQNKQIRRWLMERMESTRNKPKLDTSLRRTILEDLLRAEELEHALDTFFIGQKRFSLEGAEAIIPALHFLVDSAGRYNIEEFVIGTTHRGRLAILNTILNMSHEEILSRFEENYQPGMYGGSGDVKYHMGYEADHALESGNSVHISVLANASHLESIDAIVQGKARSLQDERGDMKRKHVVPVLLHGDAAFAGQGIVAETLNLSRLDGYTTGGTIHIIINNQIGFTTSARSARSSFFPTDVAKMLQVPIFHVNGDDPEATVHVVELALQFRQVFGNDCIIDVFCYRRHGHNEGDEPTFTQPRMYEIIEKHKSVVFLYGEHCAQLGILGKEEQALVRKEHRDKLKQALNKVRKEPVAVTEARQGSDWEGLQKTYSHEPVATGIDEDTLRSIAEHITTVPRDFSIHPKLARIIARKKKAFYDKGIVDWSFAEALTFGSLMLEGIPVRLSGEDSIRGTFSQRHLRWWDTRSEKPRNYTPLKMLSEEQALFSVYDSPLSEYSVLAFEYGYSLVQPRALVVWEAQFGDFANGAQVVIDNYIASAESKWQQSSGLVLLLPHGNEGQGPDHAGAHLQRFLQLCADDNMQVCNATTPAQYFHVLRRQQKRNFRKPLVIMAPKSLLRHPSAVSPVTDLVSGNFREVLDDSVEPAAVERVLLCSGKVFYDLLAHRENEHRADTALVRLEQLYPFPDRMLKACLDGYQNAREFVWVQDEHKNYGAWSFMLECFSSCLNNIDLRYVGRNESASTATGFFKTYQDEQKELVKQAFS